MNPTTEAKHRPVPSELLAVLTILGADDELKVKALPHVDIERREVNWFAISQNPFGSGHMAAIMWAKCLWSMRNPSHFNLFERSFSMDDSLRAAVLRGIGIAWGLG